MANLVMPVPQSILGLSMVSATRLTAHALFPLSEAKHFLLSGVNAAGSAIGAAGCSYLADKYSRKRTIQWAAMVLTIGAAICAGSVNNGMFMAGRVINGFGIGALVTAIPM